MSGFSEVNGGRRARSISKYGRRWKRGWTLYWVLVYGSIFEAELREAWEALRLMEVHFQNKSPWLEGDALGVVRDLQVSSSVLQPVVLLEDAWWMVNTKDIFKISHIHREGNQCADWLTKWNKEPGSTVVMNVLIFL